MAGTITSMLKATPRPRPRPSKVPTTPTKAPCTMKMDMMLPGLAPKVRKMAMSARLSVTNITKVLTKLNAATATIRVRMMNIMRFSTCTAANQVRFCRVQSRTHRPGSMGINSSATWRARCKSRSFKRTPLGPSSRNKVWASARCNKAMLASYS